MKFIGGGVLTFEFLVQAEESRVFSVELFKGIDPFFLGFWDSESGLIFGSIRGYYSSEIPVTWHAGNIGVR